MRFSIPGIPMRTMPALPSSKVDLICSRLFICSRSASSTRINVVGSPTDRSFGLISLVRFEISWINFRSVA